MFLLFANPTCSVYLETIEIQKSHLHIPLALTGVKDAQNAKTSTSEEVTRNAMCYNPNCHSLTIDVDTII